MREKKIASVGLGPQEFGIVSLAARQKGFEVLERQASQLGSLANDKANALIFAVRAESDLRQLLSIKADHPELTIVAAVEEGARPSLARALCLPGVLVFLLPPDASELAKHLSNLAAVQDEAIGLKAVFGGLVRLREDFSWPTQALKVSRVAHYLSGRLDAFGFSGPSQNYDETVLALEEALVNAMEHGNLELSSDLKEEGLDGDDKFEALRQERMADASFGSRPLELSLVIEARQALVVIQDHGKGFKPESLGSDGQERLTALSGKGFQLIRRAFDEMVYEDGGRRLSLIRRHERGKEE